MVSGKSWIFRASKIEKLFEYLLQNLRKELVSDAFTPLTILVGSRGMKEWLSQRLAEELGIFMNVNVEYLERGLRQALTGAYKKPISPEWSISLLAWGLLRLWHKAECPKLFSSIISGVVRPSDVVDANQLAAFFYLAELLDRLSTYRPNCLVSSPEECCPKDAACASTDSEQLVSLITLWRELEKLLGAGHLLHLVNSPSSDSLFSPLRLHVFGFVSVAPLYLQAAQRLASTGSLQMYLLAPVGDASPPEAQLLSRSSYTFQKHLEKEHPDSLISSDALPSTESGNMLKRLQAYLAGEMSHVEAELLSADDSLEVHSCAGPLRQVEVIKDRLLELFRRHPDLQPRDILVASSKPQTYGPLIEAVFSRPEAINASGESTGALPVRLNEKAPLQSTLLLEVLKKLLGFSRRRLTARSVFELLELEPVRENFFAGVDLNLLRELILQASFFWGADAADRKAEGVIPDESGTVEFSLARLAGGLAAGEEDRLLQCGSKILAPVWPLHGEEARVFGALAHFLRLLVRAVVDLRRSDGLSTLEWREWLRDYLYRLCKWPEEERIYWFEELNDMLDAADAAGFGGRLSAQALQFLVEEKMDAGRQGGALWRQAICVSSLQAARGVPYKVICLLGQEDTPQPAHRMPFLESGSAWADGDSQAEQLQIFLDAVFSARHSLIITYCGKDPATGQEGFPSAPLRLLLESAAKINQKSFAQRSRSHSCQPHEELHGTYNVWAAEVAQELGQEVENPPALFLKRDGSVIELPPIEPAEISAEELAAFFTHPARTFLQKRLGIRLEDDPGLLPEREPLELNNLQRWKVKDDLLEAMLQATAGGEKTDRHETARRLGEVLIARGELPPGAFGKQLLDEYLQEISLLFTEENLRLLSRLRARPIDIALELPQLSNKAIRIVARPEPVEGTSHLFLLFSDEAEKPKNLIWAWVYLLTLAVAEKGKAQAQLVGIKDGKAKSARLQVSTAGFAQECLSRLVQAYLVGMRRPLALPLKAAWALVKGKHPDKEYFGQYGDRDRYWDILFPGSSPLECEEFQSLARSLYQPLHENFERVDDKKKADRKKNQPGREK